MRACLRAVRCDHVRRQFLRHWNNNKGGLNACLRAVLSLLGRYWSQIIVFCGRDVRNPFLVINILFILGHPFVRGQFLGIMSEGISFSAKNLTRSMSQGSSYTSCLEAVLLQHVWRQFLGLMSEDSSYIACSLHLNIIINDMRPCSRAVPYTLK